MRKITWRLLGLLVVVATLGGLWIWHDTYPQRVISQQNNTATASPVPTTSISDNFLAIENAPAVSLDAIINNSFVIAAGTNMAKITTIVTTGDIIPARGVDIQVRAKGPDYPLAGIGIKSLLTEADLTVIDLESPLIKACPVTKSGFTFCGQPEVAASMATAGIDVATLENNHIGNYGQVGIQETIDHLTAAGLRYATDSYLDIEELHGLKFGFIAFNGVGGKFNRAQIQQTVSEDKAKVDVLLVAFHWGKEYERVPVADPSIAPDDPQEIGRITIDAGADVVIGNHPHWVQGVEVYKGKLISYALGNFIFDQSWSTETQQGMVAKYTFYGPKLIGAQFTPIHINNQAQPVVVTGDEEATIRSQFRLSSQQIAAR